MLKTDEARAKREAFLRRRRVGVLIGALLAFIFGGWIALFLAFGMVAIARIVEYRMMPK